MRDSRHKSVSPWDTAVSPKKSIKRKGGKSGQIDLADFKTQRVDVTIIFAEDTEGWDTYLTDFLNFFQESPGPQTSAGPSIRLNIRHEKLEGVNLNNITALDAQAISTTRATLIILSPAFINYIEGHADVYELCKLLKPANTVAMLCGVTDKDIVSVHRAALVSYDSWPRLVAKNTDNEFVLCLVHALQEVLAKTHESTQLINKFNLKLTPRKVKEGHNKVFLLLEQPLDPICKVQIFLEGDGVREVPVKPRNPYTLQFLVPDTYLKVSKILNVHIRCQDRLIGVLPLKVESLMGELSTILSAVDSPYELLCRTLGLDSRHQVDAFLTDRFRQRLPRGFQPEWITPIPSPSTTDVKEELPTLLHFSACYGLKLFTRLLLTSPGGNIACTMKNTRGLTPSQLANYAGHNDLASLLLETEKGTKSTGQPMSCRKLNYENLAAASTLWCIENKTYGKVNMPSGSEGSDGSIQVQLAEPPTTREQFSPTEAQADIPPPWEESTYLTMQPIKMPQCELLPHQQIIQEILNTRTTKPEEIIEETVEVREAETATSPCFTNSQNELAKILESFKQGRCIEDIEKEVHEWRRKNSVPLQEDEENLALLRLEYEKKISEKSPKNRKKGFLDIKCIFPSITKQDKKKSGVQMANSQSNTSLSSIENAECSTSGSPKCIVKKPLPIPRNTLNLEELDPSRPSSTISSSGSRASTASNLSMGSICDSGNQTDSCDETIHKNKAYVNHSVIAKTIQKIPAPVTRCTITPIRPPAPPPRIRRSPNNTDEEEHYSHPRHSFDRCSSFTTNCTAQSSPQDIRASQQEYVKPDFAAALYHQLRQNQSTPTLYKATSNQSINSRSSVTSSNNEECYWIPPPPIPVYHKTAVPSLQFPKPFITDLEYDIPKPTKVYSPTRTQGNIQFSDECHYYSIPKSVQTLVNTFEDIPNEPPPPPPS